MFLWTIGILCELRDRDPESTLLILAFIFFFYMVSEKPLGDEEREKRNCRKDK